MRMHNKSMTILEVIKQTDGYHTVKAGDQMVMNLCADEVFCAVNSTLVEALKIKPLAYFCEDCGSRHDRKQYLCQQCHKHFCAECGHSGQIVLCNPCYNEEI